MEILKAAMAAAGPEATAAQLEQINRFAKKPLGREDVYVFSVRLCDDQVDRDGERFDTDALPELARLCVGKTGVVDHAWSADRQLARIFETKVIRENGVSYIKAWAYMLKTDKTAEAIAEIEGGIKKEVSVGCSMARSVCSICGADFGSCQHRKGEAYGNEVCAAVLKESVDAYEFSFVAVPAQREAGVLKGFGAGDGGSAEHKALMADAALGRKYREELRGEIVRLGLTLEFGLDAEALRFVAKAMDDEQLQKTKKALEHIAADRFPAMCQLPQAGKPAEQPVGAEFLI